MFESKAGVLLVGGLGFFLFAFTVERVDADLYVSEFAGTVGQGSGESEFNV